MAKSSGPPLTLDLPELAPCKSCKGAGKIKPMFYEMPCDVCSGSGVVDADTGLPLDADTLIPAMKDAIRDLRIRNALLREQLSKCSCDRDREPMSKRNGGTYRMD
ncbi:hypothetical protein [Neptuniibacter pectenicola]|uniref:hypothetical protein n=1 Tax=Neptuniibacter pectenicola TaxID=1806669 RepID=UPI0012E8B6D1|nr:hypothetical protein [Neptuniibacter pectenicola]